MSRQPPDRVLDGTVNGRAPEPDQAAELDDVARFCADVTLDEIKFEDWQKLHQQLDLRIPVLVSHAEANAPGFKIVSFVRAVKSLDNEKKLRRSKLKVSKMVSWEVPLQHDQEFLFIGDGDQECEKFGDARIIVKIEI